MLVTKPQLDEYIQSAKNDGWHFTRESKNPQQDWYEAEVIVINVGKFKLLAYANYHGTKVTTCFINLWGPDELIVEPISPYRRPNKDDLRICAHCGQLGETYRYSFAGRCCKECLPEMRAQFEQEGWCK